jgi:alkaline phosphatase
MDQLRIVTRRAFLRRSAASLAGAAAAGAGLPLAEAGERDEKVQVRIGLVTDLHYADKPPAGTRHYRDSLGKLAETARRFGEERPDCVVALGDMIDSADSLDVETGYLRRVAKEFAAVAHRRHYVLGNHCVSALTKEEFLEIVGQNASFYSFDARGVHFVVLDACFRGDGTPYGRKNFEWTDSNIPAAELEWLRADLKQTRHRTVVFVHQRLDVAPPLGIKNSPEVRKALEESGKVLAVVQGHEHKGGHKVVGGIRYCTLRAMVEGPGPKNAAYAILDILPNDALRVRGFGKQESYDPL